MTLRSLARASAIYTVGNMLPRIGAFILLPVFVRFLSSEQYGVVSLVTSLAGLLTILFRVGLDGSLMRFHFDEHGVRQRDLYSTLTGMALIVALGGSLVVGLLLGPFFGALFAGIAFFPFGVLGIAIAAAGAVSFAPAIFYRATTQPGKFLAYSMASFLVGNGISVVLVVAGFGPVGMLLGQLGGAVVGLAVTAFLVVRIARARFEMSFVRPALRFGLPLTPHAISAWVLRLADRWLIGLLIGLPAAAALTQLGAYSLGYQLGYVITVVISSFQAAWAPWFFEVGDRPESPRLFREMTTVVMAGLLAVAVGVSVLAPQIVGLVARPEYAAAAGVLPVVAMGSVLYGLYTMLSTLIFYAKATGRLALITGTAAILNIAINIALIPRMGILGAAWATFGAYAYFAVASWAYARRVYPTFLDLGRLGILSVASTGALLLATLTGADPSDLRAGILRLIISLTFTLLAVILAVGPARTLLLTTRRSEVSGD